MNEARYVSEARAYLLSFPNVTGQILDLHLHRWRAAKPKSLNALFRAFLEHAKNRQGMPNSIGDVELLAPILYDFDIQKAAANYSSWSEIFDAIKASGYKPPGRMDKKNSRSYWVIYCKAVASIIKFLASFKSIEEFDDFVEGFQTNVHSRLALPLLLKEEIFGFGFALACDFLKENGYREFVKPDTHVNFIARKLGITSGTSDYHIFKDVISYCQRVDAVPYELDKLFWLIGSGSFYRSGIKIKSSRDEFVKRVLSKNSSAP